MLKLAITTSIVNAFIATISLKLLKVFHFIPWHPTRFMDNIYFVRLFAAPEKWLILGIIIFIVSFILYMISAAVPFVPGWISSIVAAIIIVFVVHSLIIDFQYKWSEMKKLPIPFIVLVLFCCRFVTETSVFYMKEKLIKESKLIRETK